MVRSTVRPVIPTLSRSRLLAEIRPVAHIKTGFSEKFGIPRQSNIAHATTAKIYFEKEFKDPQVIKGLEGFDYIWLLWHFDEEVEKLTVAPPKLGGKKHMGIFATRSPLRPNHIGLSSVRLLSSGVDEVGLYLEVGGADLMDGTAIYDIKPYLPYTDAHPNARGGYAGEVLFETLVVKYDPGVLDKLPKEIIVPLTQVLHVDPRPAYKKDSDEMYAIAYEGFDIHFTVSDGVLRVVDAIPYGERKIK